MKTKNVSIMVCAIMACFLLATAASFAQPADRPRGPAGPRGQMRRGMRGQYDQGRMAAMMKEELGLTDEQAAKLKELRTAHKELLEPANDAVAEKRKALDDIVMSGADEQTIRQAAAALGTALGNRAVLKANHIGEKKKVLTTEQFEKWQQLWENRKRMYQQRRDRRDMPGRRGRRGQWQSGNPDRIFDRRDIDDDGKISLEEFTQRPRRRVAPTEDTFKEADTDSDGYLSPEEYRQFAQKVRNFR